MKRPKKKDRKKSKKKQEEKMEITDVLLRTSISVLFTSIFIILFVVCGGLFYFYSEVIVEQYIGYDFQVHFIDVGQGDSILIKFPNNETMLIDAGEEEEGKSVTNYTKRFLKEEGLEKLIYVVMTHPDADHIGGLLSVLNEIEVDTVYRPKVYTQEEYNNLNTTENLMISTTNTYNQVLSLIKEKGCQEIFSERGLNLNLGGCDLEFLSPELNYYTSTNNISAVIMLTYQTKKFLFTGDADSQIEQTLLSQYGEELQADVLKVAHHGSNSSSSIEFLEVVSPEYSVLSVAQNKDLPSVTVLNRLNSIDSEILTTSSNGSMAFTIENDEVIVATIENPSMDIALLISIYVLLLIFTWGIKVNKKENKRKIDIIKYNTINNYDI